MKNPADFPSTQRVHISLDVSDLASSLRFYQLLLGQQPSKVRDGYAKFETAEPALNLALNQVEAPGHGDRRVSHFGIEVKTHDAIKKAKTRLEGAGNQGISEDEVTCCYAVQDKVWFSDPDGNDWELFLVLDRDAPVHSERASGPTMACCPTANSGGCC